MTTQATEHTATVNAQALDPQWVGGLQGVTRAKLDELFKRVADKKNWKRPIDAEAYLADEEVAVLEQAVIFFAGCVPKIERVYKHKYIGVANLYHVTAEGYYNAVGA